jgi:hypothetical protein
MNYLFLFNLSTAALHLIQALLVRALVPSIPPNNAKTPFEGSSFDVFKTVIVFNKTNSHRISFESRKDGSFDVVNLIMWFFLMSALFQSAAASLNWRWLRFVEYSLSATVMLVCIALEAGVRDVYTLRCMAVLMWTTQLLGLMAEAACSLSLRLRDSTLEWRWVLPHATAWVTCIAAYAPALDAFLENQDKAPDFVKWIVYLELLLFMSFGAVQLYGLTRKTLLDSVFVYVEAHAHSCAQVLEGADAEALERIDVACEYAYTTLSLVAKTLLGWIVISPLLAAA